MSKIISFYGKGHHDVLLAEVSKKLQSCMRPSDMIGRHDEHGFLILVKCDSSQAEGVAQRLCGIIQKHTCIYENKSLRTTITIGISVYPEHGRNLHDLYRKAQCVVEHCRANDIRGYAYYNKKIHADNLDK